MEWSKNLGIVYGDVSIKSTDGMLVTDSNGRIKIISKEGEAILGYRQNEFLNKTLPDIAPVESHEKLRRFFEQIINDPDEKTSLREYLILRKKDGSPFPAEINLHKFTDPETGVNLIGTFSDISEKTEKEETEELKLKNAILENKLKLRTLELTRALEREKANNDLKSRFVTVASHEFRTPLATILSSLHLIEKYTLPTEHSLQKKHIERIKTSVEKLTEILSDLLSLDHLERGEMKSLETQITLKPFTDNAVQKIKYLLRDEQTIDVTYSGNKSIITDKKILHTVLINLLSNACHFSKPGNPISLSINATPDNLILSVSDKGIGIPQSDQKNIFTPLFRARNAESIQGTGLGLSITKKYLELIGGNISFKSKENEGSVFTVIIPIKDKKHLPL